MKLFFDTEFTGLRKQTTLISIGIISENGKSFYAECEDYDKFQVDDWIQKNVINNLYGKYDMPYSDYNDTYIIGKTKDIKIALLKWLKQFSVVEWVSDVCHYDMVLLMDLLAGDDIISLDNSIAPCCHDINQDIARYYGIFEYPAAFNYSREKILLDNNINMDLRKIKKHNSLYDAYVIKTIYEIINK